MGIAYDRGILLYQQKRYPLAAEEFRRELATAPNHARSHAMLCLSLLNCDRREEADVEGRRAIELDPNLAFGYYALSFVALRGDGKTSAFKFAISRQHIQRKLRRQQLAAAKDLLNTAVSLEPANAEFLGQLAAVHFDLRDFDASLAAAERGLRWSPLHRQCADIRTRALAKLGRHREAIATVERTLATDPEQAAAHATRGWLLLRRGRVKEAHPHFLEALRLSPNDKRALNGLKAANGAIHPIFGFPRRLLLRIPGGGRSLIGFIWLALIGANVLRGQCNDAGKLAVLAIVGIVALAKTARLASPIVREKFRSQTGASKSEVHVKQSP